MRIISGTHRGRSLTDLPPKSNIRPTSDRTREALFNILKHRIDETTQTSILEQARIADICCGSGAIWCEALSNGAAHVKFIDHQSAAISCAKKNAALFKNADCQFLQTSITQLPLAQSPYTILFVDPPYHDHTIWTILPDALIQKGWMDARSLFITEQHVTGAPIEHPQLLMENERKYGKNLLRFYRLAV